MRHMQLSQGRETEETRSWAAGPVHPGAQSFPRENGLHSRWGKTSSSCKQCKQAAMLRRRRPPIPVVFKRRGASFGGEVTGEVGERLLGNTKLVS